MATEKILIFDEAGNAKRMKVRIARFLDNEPVTATDKENIRTTLDVDDSLSGTFTTPLSVTSASNSSFTGGGKIGIGTSVPPQTLTVQGGGVQIAGAITSPASGVSALLLDWVGSNSRYWSRGADATTQGKHNFYVLENDGGNQVNALEINASGLKFPASGLGIDFGSGSSTTLDDFERGSVSATDQSGAGLTLAANSGTYIKVGGQVTVWCQVQYPTTSDTSQAVIGGLPFAIGSSASDRVGGIVAYTTHSGVLTVLGINGFGRVQLFKNGQTAALNSELSGKHVWFTITYDIS